MDQLAIHQNMAKGSKCVASLLNLALTSRRIYALTLPVLYYHFCQPDPKSLVLFFCQIIRYPHIAEHVRIFAGVSGKWLPEKYLCSNPDSEWEDVQVSDEEDENQVFDDRLNLSSVSETNWRRIRDCAVTAINSSRKTEKWVRDIKAGSWDALMALLLFHLPNLRKMFTALESLSITDWWNYPGTPYFKASKILGHLKGSLEELYMSKHVTACDDSKPSTRYDDNLVGSLSGFHKLERLKISALMIQGSIDGLSSGTDERPRLVNLIPRSLKHLTLIDCVETHGRIVEEIFELISQRAEKAPELKILDIGVIDVTCSYFVGSLMWHPGFTLHETARLLECCINARVVFSIAKHRCSDMEAVLGELWECEICHSSGASEETMDFEEIVC